MLNLTELSYFAVFASLHSLRQKSERVALSIRLKVQQRLR